MSTAITLHQGGEPGAITQVRQALDELKAFRTFVAEELKPGLDFGAIPGTDKPTLLQPGAQKIAMYFNAYPEPEVKATELGNGHVEYLVTTRLIHRGSQHAIGQGMGSCTTMESRYCYRHAARKCPACGAEAIIQGRAEYGGGLICFKKKGGCGAKWGENDPRLRDQKAGKVENENIHDVRNTVLKMAVKRSLVAASMALGCASEMFTQDLEDVFPLEDAPSSPPPASPPPPDPRKEAKRAVNEQFKPAAPPQPAKEFLRREIVAANDDWTTEQAFAEIAEADRKKLVGHGLEAVNHIVSKAIEVGHLNPATVAKADGTTRDPAKAKEASEWLYGQHRDWFVAETRAWLKARQDAARAILDGDPPDDPGEMSDAEAREEFGPGAS